MSDHETEYSSLISANAAQAPSRTRASRALVGAVLATTFGAGSHMALADAAAGEATFAQCAGCHAVGPDAPNRFGPQLNGILERGAGNADSYAYSAAMKSRVEGGLEWNVQTLDAYLEAPMSYISGTKMAYPGLKSADDRENVIAYLAAFSPDGSTGEEPGAPDAQAMASHVTASDEPLPLARDVPVPEHGVLHLGRLAFEEEVSAWDIDIRPDGLGLPQGRGSVETGGELYDAQCASCHGVFGEGEGRWPMLAGGQDTLTDDRPEKTIGSYWPYLSTVYDYVRRAMPFGNARSLSDDDVYALTAYLLYMNDLADEEFELTSENFSEIGLPNERNFLADTRSEESWFESAEEPCMSDCVEGEATIVMRARVLDVTPDREAEDAQNGGVD